MVNESATPDAARGTNLSGWLLFYAVIYAVFHILPVFMNFEVSNKIMVGDLFDLATPFVMLLTIYAIQRRLRQTMPLSDVGRCQRIISLLLIIGAIIFVEGHGMHLSANAIARHLTQMPGTPLYAATYFFDETLGHILWDGGILVMTVGLLWLSLSSGGAAETSPRPVLLAPAMVLYGFTYFVNAIEGQTVVFTFPAAVVIPIAVWLAARRRRIRLLRHPVLILFVGAYTVAVTLFVIWRIWQGGFPEFSDLGWI